MRASLWVVIVSVVCVVNCSPLLFLYGKHYPSGQAAVDYIYSDLGMWRNFTPAQYLWNYYNYSNLPAAHPFNISALVAYSTGEHVTTCLDANEHLLLDYNHDGEIDTTDGGFSFHEHSGRGEGDKQLGNPFNNFWFDDNSLCQYMSAAYDMPLPHGLSNYSDFTRWRIVGGDPVYWTPYPNDATYIDQLALNGLYYITQNNYIEALTKWKEIIQIANVTWNDTAHQFEYGITQTYYFGLFAILTNFLRFFATNPVDSHLFLQHSIAIRSSILSNQIVNSTTGELCSWCTNIPIGGSVQNAETTACNTLGLGAASRYTFEVGSMPLENDGYYILQPYHVLSAVVGSSAPGFMSLGPFWNFAVGPYTAEFVLRSLDNTAGIIATIDIYDEDTTTVLVSQDIETSQLASGDWNPFTLNFTITNAGNYMDFRIYWHAIADLDASVIHIW